MKLKESALSTIKVLEQLNFVCFMPDSVKNIPGGSQNDHFYKVLVRFEIS